MYPSVKGHIRVLLAFLSVGRGNHTSDVEIISHQVPIYNSSNLCKGNSIK